MTVVNLLHVLTQDLEPTLVPVMRDTPEMEKPAKVVFFTFFALWIFFHPNRIAMSS